MEDKHLYEIIVVIVGLVVLLGFTGNLSLTGKATDNILDCEDTDSGINSEIGGHVLGSFNPTISRDDYCLNTTTLGEYYCDKERSDGMIKEVFCEFGCVEDGAYDVCRSGPNQGLVCDSGCAYNGNCVPIGTRVEGRYCDWRNVLRVQKEGSCDNIYECKSNLCLSGQC